MPKLWPSRIPRHVAIMQKAITTALRLEGYPEAQFVGRTVRPGRGGFWARANQTDLQVFIVGQPPRPVTALQCAGALIRAFMPVLGEDTTARVVKYVDGPDGWVEVAALPAQRANQLLKHLHDRL